MLTREHLTPAYMAENVADRAVLIVDLCGFSRTVKRIEDFPLFGDRVVRLGGLAGHVVARWRGDLVKCEADNVYALFATVDDALRAAREFHRGGLDLSCGISIGPVLRVPGDLWGPAVNEASRLGEDLAGPGETLLSGPADGRRTLPLSDRERRQGI